MMRGSRIAGALAAVLVAAPVVAGAGETTVEVGHNRLSPTEVTIAVGDEVTFVNLDAMPGGHSVAADDGSFTSPALDKDASWSHTFEAAGSVAIHIVEHPTAKATIIVE